MGLFDAGIHKARERQKQSVLAEAVQAGSGVVQFAEYSQDTAPAQSAIGGSLKALFGGVLQFDAIQVFHLDMGGWRHGYVQPYSGMNPMPGAHHAWLSGSLPAAAVLRRGGLLGRQSWESPGDPALAGALASHPQIAAVARALEWDWAIGMGKVELDWTLQFRSTGSGHTHLVMQAGRYGGLTTYHVGFAQFLSCCRVLHPWLRQEVNAVQPLPVPTLLGEAAGLFITTDAPRSGVSPGTPPPA